MDRVFVCFRYDSHSGGEREIQRTMLELLNQLDGFDSKGDVKVNSTMHIQHLCNIPVLSTQDNKYSHNCILAVSNTHTMGILQMSMS